VLEPADAAGDAPFGLVGAELVGKIDRDRLGHVRPDILPGSIGAAAASSLAMRRSRRPAGAAAASGREAAPVERREARPEFDRFLHDVVAIIAVERRLIDEKRDRKIHQGGLEHASRLAIFGK
jgi:hypothetical protein